MRFSFTKRDSCVTNRTLALHFTYYTHIFCFCNIFLLFCDKYLLANSNNSNNKILCKQPGAICHLFFCLQRILLFTVHFIIFLYSFINSFRNLFKIFIVCSIVNIVLFPMAIFQLLLQFFLLGNPA